MNDLVIFLAGGSKIDEPLQHYIKRKLVLELQ